MSDPVNSGGLKSKKDEKNFVERGLEIVNRLKEELPDRDIIIDNNFFEKYSDQK